MTHPAEATDEMNITSHQWTALVREAAIAGQSLSAGLAALRKANYAATGLYSHAFFSLSIGMERTLKLIFLIDYAITHDGEFPKEAHLKKFGHDLVKLFEYANGLKRTTLIGKQVGSLTKLEREIVEFLARFAKSARYYNLDYLTNQVTTSNSSDPISDWWTKIGEKLLEKYYSQKNQVKDELAAEAIANAITPYAGMIVSHTAEDGTSLRDFKSASIQTGKNKVVQKYGTFHCARISRFLYLILYELRHVAHSKMIPVPFVEELFFPFMNDDHYLMGRKTFPPRSQ